MYPVKKLIARSGFSDILIKNPAFVAISSLIPYLRAVLKTSSRVILPALAYIWSNSCDIECQSLLPFPDLPR